MSQGSQRVSRNPEKYRSKRKATMVNYSVTNFKKGMSQLVWPEVNTALVVAGDDTSWSSDHGFNHSKPVEGKYFHRSAGFFSSITGGGKE